MLHCKAIIESCLMLCIPLGLYLLNPRFAKYTMFNIIVFIFVLILCKSLYYRRLLTLIQKFQGKLRSYFSFLIFSCCCSVMLFGFLGIAFMN